MIASLPDHTMLSTKIVESLSRELKVPAADIELDLPLTQYGLDSIAALTMAGELEEELGLELPSTLVWDYPTINDLAGYLTQNLGARNAVAMAA